MESLQDWGIEVVLWFQRFSPALDPPFQFLTQLGDQSFLSLLVPLIYWCLDRRVGARLSVLLLFSSYSNVLAKDLAALPRPFQYDTRVQRLWEVQNGGLPSGHTQHAVVVWGYLSSQFRRRWVCLLAGLLVILIPLSRIYLGVHFPQDLLAGYLLGGTILLLHAWLDRKLSRWLGEMRLARRVVAALAVPILLAAVLPTENGIAASGGLMGMCVGLILEYAWIGFSSAGVWWKRLFRYALGMAPVGALWIGLQEGFSLVGTASQAAVCLMVPFVAYGLLGLWVSLGAPWVFVSLGLAERRTSQQG